MTTREKWYRSRIEECIKNILEVGKIENWDDYRMMTHELAVEILYCTTEWEKYYRDLCK